MNKKELRAKLDELGIVWNSKMSKSELEVLLPVIKSSDLETREEFEERIKKMEVVLPLQEGEDEPKVVTIGDLPPEEQKIAFDFEGRVERQRRLRKMKSKFASVGNISTAKHEIRQRAATREREVNETE